MGSQEPGMQHRPVRASRHGLARATHAWARKSLCSWQLVVASDRPEFDVADCVAALSMLCGMCEKAVTTCNEMHKACMSVSS